MSTIINEVGAINALIIGSLTAYAIIAGIVVCAGMWLYELYQNKQAENEAEAEAPIGSNHFSDGAS